MRNVLRRRRLNASLLLGLVSAATAAAGIAAPVPATVQPYTPTDPSTLPNAGATVHQPVFKGAPGARNAHVRPQSSRNKIVAIAGDPRRLIKKITAAVSGLPGS